MMDNLPARFVALAVPGPEERYVSRAGLKLSAALRSFGLDTTGWIAADLGSNVGGFVDCLLCRGAARVYAIDTGYGVLAWTLRKDPRVVVMERHNAMHVHLPEPVDMVTIDTGWTRQAKILPSARTLLKPSGCVVTLIKPHYESEAAGKQRGILTAAQSHQELARVITDIQNTGWCIQGIVASPILGQSGNMEFLAWLRPGAPDRRRFATPPLLDV
ncbi:MAG: TlyA family RNA methyltransferase [Phycisphaerae bacterium]